MSEIVLDRKTFGALAEETRIKILKALRERPKMQSELAKEQKLAVSTIAEHMGKLEAAGLVRAKRGEHKWVYFRLTQKGEQVVSPEKHTGVFVFALSVSLLMIAGSLFMMLPPVSTPTQGAIKAGEGTAPATPLAGAEDNKTEPVGAQQTISTMPLEMFQILLVVGVILLITTATLWNKTRRMK